MRRALLRGSLSFALAGSIVIAGAAPAFAAKPVKPACVGGTFSGLATTQPVAGDLGHGVAAFAQEPFNRPGIGDGIGFLAAGFVPDGLVPNVCN